ncbi:hypothetical protein ACYSNR_13920 [Enterococcus sp. LJL128]|uniref:hypothetical protein n=1 Tax=Enterococcus sp. LJL51 TaxID=3416656 RepID=UPI003CF80E99
MIILSVLSSLFFSILFISGYIKIAQRKELLYPTKKATEQQKKNMHKLNIFLKLALLFLSPYIWWTLIIPVARDIPNIVTGNLPEVEGRLLKDANYGASPSRKKIVVKTVNGEEIKIILYSNRMKKGDYVKIQHLTYQKSGDTYYGKILTHKKSE